VVLGSYTLMAVLTVHSYTGDVGADSIKSQSVHEMIWHIIGLV
jgi:hypothetical protein